MTLIGLAFNLRPDSVSPSTGAALESATDEEPPGSNHPGAPPFGAPGSAVAPALSAALEVDDEYAEWDEEETIAAVEHALGALGRVVRLEATEDFPERLRSLRPTLLFNIAEGSGGANRESHVPAICEFFGVPYSGSDPFTLSLCLHKARTKETLAFHGVPTAPFLLVRSHDELPGLGAALSGRAGGRVSLPVFVKPVHEGSSKGITERNYCTDASAAVSRVDELLTRYRQPVLVERYLPGAEFTCAVLGNGRGARVLPLVGMNFASLPEGALPVYGFEAKWIWDGPSHPLKMFDCPARVDETTRRRVEEVALRAYDVLGCRDWSRIDVRLDEAGEPNVVEVNPLPGILPDPDNNSCLPKAARAAGMTYDELIQACALHAAERQGVALPARPVRH
jgi:D-alanine-D-alanine ligase